MTLARFQLVALLLLVSGPIVAQDAAVAVNSNLPQVSKADGNTSNAGYRQVALARRLYVESSELDETRTSGADTGSGSGKQSAGDARAVPGALVSLIFGVLGLLVVGRRSTR